MYIHPGQCHDNQHGWHNKACPTDDESGPTSPQVAEMNSHFRGVRSRDEIDGSEQIKKALLIHPLAAPHDLVTHHGNVRGWSAKGSGAEFEEQQRDFGQALARRLLRSRGRCGHRQLLTSFGRTYYHP
jgi:hypothetical protein